MEPSQIGPRGHSICTPHVPIRRLCYGRRATQSGRLGIRHSLCGRRFSPGAAATAGCAVTHRSHTLGDPHSTAGNAGRCPAQTTSQCGKLPRRPAPTPSCLQAPTTHNALACSARNTTRRSRHTGGGGYLGQHRRELRLVKDEMIAVVGHVHNLRTTQREHPVQPQHQPPRT